MKKFDRLTLAQRKTLYKKAKNAYYEKSDPIMTDAEFDALEDMIREEDPKWVGFKTGAPVSGKTKVKLPIPMFSLDKFKPGTGIEEWVDPQQHYVVMDKLDGSSVELIYEGGIPTRLITRGDGKIGGDVSYMLQYLRGIPPRISSKKRVIVRCEGLFTKAAFNKHREDFKAQRNAASGILNGKTVHRATKDLSIVALSLLEPNVAPSKGLAWLKAQGFTVVANKSFPAKKIHSEFLRRLLANRKVNSKYDVDGLVVTRDAVNRLPTSGNPEWSVAFKVNVSADDAPRTTITAVQWKVSSHGYIIPKLNVAPVNIDGATVKNCTAKNTKYLLEHKLGVGAVVRLVRSGDIIPEVLRVEKGAPVKLPSQSQFGEYGWDKTKTHLVLKNPKASAAVRMEKITRTFDKLDVDLLRGKTVQALIDAGLDNVTKILSAGARDFLRVEGFKAAKANKLYQAIHEKTDKGFPIVTLANASGIFDRGVGERRLEEIHAVVPLTQLMRWDEKKIIRRVLNIRGVKDVTAGKLARGLVLLEEWLKRTGLKINENTVEKVEQKSSKLKGQRVTWTGYRSNDQERHVKENGGEVVNFGSKTTYLLVSPAGRSSGKAEKFSDKGGKVGTWEEFVNSFKL